MNRKLVITQRSDLIKERLASNLVSRLPVSYENEMGKSAEHWLLQQSGTFCSRSHAETEERCEPLQRLHSVSSSTDRPHKQMEPDLASVVCELTRLSSQTQERLAALSNRLSCLEASLCEFRSTCTQCLTQQVERSLDELYGVLSRDFKLSEESILKHVSDIRTEVRGVTHHRLEALQLQNEREVRERVDDLRREIGHGVDRLREDMEREFEKARQHMQTCRHRQDNQQHPNDIGGKSLVKFLCSVMTDKQRFPILMEQCWYYVTAEGQLTDQQGYLLTDSRGESIRLLPEHLSKLRSAGLLE